MWEHYHVHYTYLCCTHNSMSISNAHESVCTSRCEHIRTDYIIDCNVSNDMLCEPRSIEEGGGGDDVCAHCTNVRSSSRAD